MTQTTQALDREAVRRAAQEALDARMATIDRAIEATNRVSEVAAELAHAEAAAAAAYADAQRAGWTPEELRRIGLVAAVPATTGGRKRSGTSGRARTSRARSGEPARSPDAGTGASDAA